MLLTALNAISPIDGRYRSKTKSLSAYFSEEALIKYRVRVEIEYFIGLCELPLPQLKGFNISQNKICSSYPSCVENFIGEQNKSSCD